MPENIRDVIRHDHLERLHALDRGESVTGGSHRNLLRLRIWALLAIAAVPAVVSDATVRRGEERRDAEARAKARADTDRAARHAVAASQAVEADAVDRLARKLCR